MQLNKLITQQRSNDTRLTWSRDLKNTSPTIATSIHTRPAELAQALLRFDTTNPPGCEIKCIEYIESVLDAYDIKYRRYAIDPSRPNLVARLPGGNSNPLMLYGHVDVVTTENQTWTYPPFGGEIHNGWLWGRGALDMKGGDAMLLSAFLRAKQEQLPLPGDVILTFLSDEEAGGEHGAKFMVENHPDIFANVKYAIGELGGYSHYYGGQTFYPIMIAEKTVVRIRITVQGPGGHGAMVHSGTAMAKAGKILTLLEEHRLPPSITPAAQSMLKEMAKALPLKDSSTFLNLLDTTKTDAALDSMPNHGRELDPLLHNTVNATFVRGGTKINVIPGHIEIDLDARQVPGSSPEDLIIELRHLLGDDLEIEILEADPPGPSQPDMGLFQTLSSILLETDKDGHPVPFMTSGATDGRFFARLGIQTYGFLPMKLPEGFDFTRLLHTADERIPVDALEFGHQAIYKVLQRFGNAP